MTDEKAIEAAGRVREAFETIERARGHLYSFHQLTGNADLKLDEAVTLLREAGHEALAQQIETDLIGRNVLFGRWTFQVVEEYDDDYYRAFADWEAEVRKQLTKGQRHCHEARMKAARRTPGRPHHEANPGSERRR
ncbi:hypothetical protein JOF53_008383 [Crossiella equi]|uniref:Uncharacterized protein n=1 Tax=Crossiella equi TaxID=130796 RepID=A0ABS5ASV7_9PSEU|nr:hypothetical protein [Crossiella equi]MBP2479511.1 hypothetical protein [Crossiella equi]